MKCKYAIFFALVKFSMRQNSPQIGHKLYARVMQPTGKQTHPAPSFRGDMNNMLEE